MLTEGEEHFLTKYPRCCAWCSFFAGLTILLLIDHLLRIQDGHVEDGGLPEIVYYGVPTLLGFVSLWFLTLAARKYKHLVIGLLEVSGHLAMGFVIYAFVLLYYVVGTGIDSL